nr:MAG TPA: hypothetical protein [Caudoviricetes sp.]DAU87585.1 MAG TPA: hypothetical protein [Caudoviricetes sp.]DAW42665.1 MAG TPA: hypothetical protein [Caudoviricetes sp.]DAW90834.1 MAG TPA: hypothetical protein [Caudoviricetes sp.]
MGLLLIDSAPSSVFGSTGCAKHLKLSRKPKSMFGCRPSRYSFSPMSNLCRDSCSIFCIDVI